MDDERRRYLSNHPGTPLGRGYPSGVGIREDGESHLAAWHRILRADPCPYCSGPGGTLEHIEPQNPLVAYRGLGGKWDWTNLAGACLRCNEAKRDKSLLKFLHGRAAAALYFSSVVRSEASATSVSSPVLERGAAGA